jgi:hypothetical protein
MEQSLPVEELLYEEEGTTLDFKREQYKYSGASDYEKSELWKSLWGHPLKGTCQEKKVFLP